jgi:uncharacterized protein YjbI with pentapeptide repeats
MRNTNFYRSKFQYSSLVSVDLRDADMREVDFARANIGGANLEGAKLHGAKNMNQAIGLDKTRNLDKAHL